jgi:hypothetical protein
MINVKNSSMHKISFSIIPAFFLTFVLIFFATAASAGDEVYAVSGVAYNLKNGAVVYRELFTHINADKEVQVNYVRPTGAIFARKTLNYNTEVFQPGSVFNDERDDETVSAQFDAGRLLLTHRIKGDSQTKTIYDTAKLVIDAGVDAFIQQNWGKLVNGKKVEFDFANARHVGVEKFVIKEIDVSASPLAYKGAAQSWKYFRIDTANKLASLFTEPMFYAYEPEGKFLMRYQGRANIDDDKGELWDVRIEYQYW